LVARFPENPAPVRRGGHCFQLREAIFFCDIDVGILAAPSTEPDLHTEPLLREQLYFIGPLESGLSPDTPRSLDEVPDHPLILRPVPTD
jgi:LysR family nitrogen assimilation transcriptional regulator